MTAGRHASGVLLFEIAELQHALSHFLTDEGYAKTVS